MIFKHQLTLLATIAALCGLTACNNSGSDDTAETASSTSSDDTHTHADGSTHGEHEHEGDVAHEDEEDGHAHAEKSLGTVTIDNMEVELAQGHGAFEAGREGHLVVKLPYSDNGATIVRAWIGTEDRTMSYVCKGEYAPSHDDYDIHATAPDPLPENAEWWIEIEKPDGTTVTGSAQPIMK